jgi:membrane protein
MATARVEAVLRSIPFATVIRDAAVQWVHHKDARLGAALAFSSIFSIGPVIVIAVAIAGLVYGGDAARTRVILGLTAHVGERGTDAVNLMLRGASKPNEDILALVVGVTLLIVGAIGLVMQLKDALNTVWEHADPTTGGLWRLIRNYVLALVGVLFLGSALLVSMLIATLLSALADVVASSFPVTLQLLELVASFALITLMFAAMFKWLPDTHVDWRDVWLGALVTAALFEIGKLAIAYYLGRLGLESTFGAAASIVALLLWVYFTAQIILFGAEFTNVIYKRRLGHAMRQLEGEGGR